MRSILNTTTVAIEILYVSGEQWMDFINSIKWQLTIVIIVAAFYRELRKLIKGIAEIKFGSFGITIAYFPDVRETPLDPVIEEIPTATVIDFIPTTEP